MSAARSAAGSVVYVFSVSVAAGSKEEI